mmetsp:Transcript_9811/g.21265  ORF Transcript_9811/g.21265 Transcript_9811/m.21265 type:complete len:80 (-) Transcript_9811:366-605(-)
MYKFTFFSVFFSHGLQTFSQSSKSGDGTACKPSLSSPASTAPPGPGHCYLMASNVSSPPSQGDCPHPNHHPKAFDARGR